jgi:gamma-glutamyl-gamma-aminobutyrate hydrolase PuuD
LLAVCRGHDVMSFIFASRGHFKKDVRLNANNLPKHRKIHHKSESKNRVENFSQIHQIGNCADLADGFELIRR